MEEPVVYQIPCDWEPDEFHIILYEDKVAFLLEGPQLTWRGRLIELWYQIKHIIKNGNSMPQVMHIDLETAAELAHILHDHAEENTINMPREVWN